MKCGKCWENGHVGTRCKSPPLNLTAKPYWPKKPIKHTKEEPHLDELLTGVYPYVSPVMPDNQAEKTFYYIHRDGAYFKEMEKMKNTVLVRTDKH